MELCQVSVKTNDMTWFNIPAIQKAYIKGYKDKSSQMEKKLTINSSSKH